MLRAFQKIILKKFILFISDRGASLMLFNKYNIIERLEVSGVADEQITQITSLLRKHPKVPIYLLSDVSDQSFKHINIPSTNPLIIKKLLARRASRDFQKNDLNNYYLFKDKEEKSKNSSHYIMANIARVPPLSEWLDYLRNIPNPISAVYSLAVELSGLSHDLELCLTKSGKAVAESRWKMLVMQNKKGGFRVVVTKDGQTIFSRMLNFDEILDNEHVDMLKNQIIGTVEYLRRIGFKDKQGISLFLIFENKLHDMFNIESIKGYNAVKVSQEELSQAVGGKSSVVETAIEQELSRYFVSKGRFFGFYTKNLELVANLSNINIGLTVAAVASAAFLAIYIMLNFQGLAGIKKNIERMSLQKNKLEQNLENIRQEKFGFDIDENKVIDVARLHEMLQAQKLDPLDIIIKLSDMKPENIKIKDFAWSNLENDQMSFEVDATFVSKDLSYEELFTKYDSFIRNLKKSFNLYEIEHSELPDTISFDLNLEDIPIDFKITGPVKKEGNS